MSEQLVHYLKAWKLSDPQLLAKTATSHVYTVTSEGTQVVLKLLSPIGIADESKGAIALRHFAGQGAVRLLRQDDQAHLLEFADGEDLTVLVKRGEDEKATLIIANVLNQIHAAPAESLPSELTALVVWFRDLFRRADKDWQQGLGAQSIFVRAAYLAKGLFAEPREVRVLHGDIHHENIRHQAHRGWLAFDPKGLVGERTFDAANTFCNPMNMPEFVENEARILKTAELFSQKLDIERSRILDFVFIYTCLSASWILYDGNEAPHELRIAALVEPHLRH